MDARGFSDSLEYTREFLIAGLDPKLYLCLSCKWRQQAIGNQTNERVKINNDDQCRIKIPYSQDGLTFWKMPTILETMSWTFFWHFPRLQKPSEHIVPSFKGS